MLALVAFSEGATTLCSFTGAFDAKFAAAVQQLPAVAARGGTTNLTAALRTANDLIMRMPPGLRRRIWLLTDGHANVEVDGLWHQVTRAASQRCNINTVGFGARGEFDEPLLRRIAGATHNGRYCEATSIAALGQAFRRAAGKGCSLNHKGEATVFCIDASASMTTTMEGRTRIEAVRAAMNNLIVWKQANWS
jgi:Mg-chelatase subunit ChlD